MVDVIEKLFGSSLKPKIMRTFIYNPTAIFDIDTIARRVRSRAHAVKKEITLLEKINFLKKRMTKNSEGRKVNGFFLNQNFVFLSALKNFLMSVSPFTDEVIARKISSIGRVKLVVLLGMFMPGSESRIDMLVVADHPHEKKLKKVLEEIEAEFGREIVFALFSTEDFYYRQRMGDKLLRDVFDFAHIIVLDRRG